MELFVLVESAMPQWCMLAWEDPIGAPKILQSQQAEEGRENSDADRYQSLH